MALAYAQSLGDGVTTIFTVPFPYISKTHVQVTVDGVAVAYAWLSPTSVQIIPAPAVDKIVDRRRVTPRDTLLVDFVDGSTLVESELDLSALQVFYLAQESFDLGESSLGVTEDGSFSALGRRISNVLTPTQANDVATKQFVEDGVTSGVNIATQKAAEASAYAVAAGTSETNAAASASSASASKTVATTKASEAATSATNAAGSATTAATKATEAAASASEALGYRNTASTKAAEAAASAAAAAAFDPSTFYTKTEINTSLAGKFDKIGGTVTGDVSIQRVNPSLVLDHTGVNKWGVLSAANGSLYIQKLNGTVVNALTIGADGALSTAQLGDLNARIDARALNFANDRVANLAFRKVSSSSFNVPDNGLMMCPAGAVLTGMNMQGTSNNPAMHYHYLQSFDPVRGWVTFSGS
ncbi:putative T7-like tail fiber protein [Rhizobium phage RHEph01]|uniref:Putative T7-like tail fiber protein n=1 Tax=Rhizobium phage RHEph01 TaxID=1220601 RepID=L7TLW7_9CAUD|nr:tail fiber protein [Rhizobium phage RHEph01]AGC35557.1 putative T7-like tail fiber protein [Rhizobium phage RHEph01]